MKPTQGIQNLVGAFGKKKAAKLDRVLKSMKVRKDDGTEDSLSDRAQAALKACARILAPFAEEISDANMDAMQEEIGMSEEPEGDVDGEETVELEKGKSIPQQLSDQSDFDDDEDEEDEDEEDEFDRRMRKSKEESVDTKVKKSALDLSAFPEGQRGQLEAVFKSNTDLREANKVLVEKQAKLENDLKARDEKEKSREYVAKAAELKGCGVPQEELVTVLKNAAAVSTENYELVCKAFATTAKQLEQSDLFKEVGSRQAGKPCDAEARLNQLVDSVVAKADGKMSHAALYDQVLQSAEGKKLYGEMKSARKGGI